MGFIGAQPIPSEISQQGGHRGAGIFLFQPCICYWLATSQLLRVIVESVEIHEGDLADSDLYVENARPYGQSNKTAMARNNYRPQLPIRDSSSFSQH